MRLSHSFDNLDDRIPVHGAQEASFTDEYVAFDIEKELFPEVSEEQVETNEE